MSRDRIFLLITLFSLAVIIFSLQVMIYYGFDNVKAAVLSLVAQGQFVRQVSAIPPSNITGNALDPVGDRVQITKPPEPAKEHPEPKPEPEPEPKPKPDVQTVQEDTGPVPGVIHSIPGAGKKIALTFDDGPSPLTPEYLRVLGEQGVRATFFTLGSHIRRYPGMLALIAKEGHEIGDHSFSHRNLKLLSVDAAEQDILSALNLIEQETHQKARFFRPPGGNVSPALVKTAEALGMKTVLWSIDPKDWKPGNTSARIVRHVLTHLGPGSIVVMHEGKPQTLGALPALIQELKKGGWQLVTVSELLAEGQVTDGLEQVVIETEPPRQNALQTIPQQ
ncbi:MAG TPA: polysaccharide deacetylase family protein [Syntrophomonadaceae bacterium]|nr:polysaccharide deacetylase family protein [Syntrophomonadaceae bacterium]